MTPRTRYAPAAVAVGLYGAALFLPTVTIFRVTMSGYRALEIAWAAVTEPAGDVLGWLFWTAAWLPNPLILVALAALLAGRRRGARYAAVIAVLLCVVTGAIFGGMVVRHPGYWAWTASAAVLAAGGLVGRVESSRPDAAGPVTRGGSVGPEPAGV